jgi:predicted metal-dependent enzyme (double-stranded beta helix superfamily)
MAVSEHLATFVSDFDNLVQRTKLEEEILGGGAELLSRLVSRDDWISPPFTRADPKRYTQYLLHLDPARRFSVVSFVWGPDQKTPVHDHTVWGLVGMLRGAEISQRYRLENGTLSPFGAAHRLEPGDVEAVSPRIGDIHQVSNAFNDRVSISIHIYGGDIGCISRHTYTADGKAKPFVSGYTGAHA